MKNLSLKSVCFTLAAFAFLFAGSAAAQNCSNPAFPTSSETTTQDRDQMMCQQNLTFPVLPTLQGSSWPWGDPTAPTNAWPKTLTSPTGNWTDAQSHTIVRTAWGNWHTYDADPMYEPDPSAHFTAASQTGSLDGGALSGVGPYDPTATDLGYAAGYPLLPVLQMKDGTTISTPEDWWTKRRPEIWHYVQTELFGDAFNTSVPCTTATAPGTCSPAVTWTVGATTSGSQTVSGVAYPYRQKTFTGTVDKSSYPALRNTPTMTFACRFPAATGKKYPVIATIAESNTNFQYTAPYGYGVCGYTQTSLQPDSGGANLSSYVIGLVNKGNWRQPTDPGALVVWGWGISRFIDYVLANDSDIDGDKIAVEGHSRDGKATLVAAAYDDRIVAALPSCGGQLGTQLYRRTYGETFDFVTSSTSEYHWVDGYSFNFAGPVQTYDGLPDHQFPRKVQNLDVDSYSVLALIAPRPVMTNGGTDTPQGNGDAWQDPRGMFLTGHFASPAWEVIGWPGQIIPSGTVFTSPGSPGAATCITCGPAESVGGTPPYDTAFTTGTVAWRRHSPGHTDTPEWPVFAQWITKYVFDNRPVIAPGQSFTLGDGEVSNVGTVQATDADGDALQNWQFKGGDGVGLFAINRTTGQITVPDASKIDTSRTTPWSLTVMVGDGKLPSHDETVEINPAPIVTGSVQLVSTASLAKNSDGSYTATLTVTNKGTGTAQNVSLNSASLGAAAGSPVPQSLINIPPSEVATTTVSFGANAGASGSAVLEKYSGSYKGGTFSGSLRAILP